MSDFHRRRFLKMISLAAGSFFVPGATVGQAASLVASVSDRYATLAELARQAYSAFPEGFWPSPELSKMLVAEDDSQQAIEMRRTWQASRSAIISRTGYRELILPRGIKRFDAMIRHLVDHFPTSSRDDAELALNQPAQDLIDLSNMSANMVPLSVVRTAIQVHQAPLRTQDMPALASFWNSHADVIMSVAA